MSNSVRNTPHRDSLVWNFMGELDTQCALAETAYTSLVLALGVAGNAAAKTREHQREVFLYAHAFLTHASLVATILWPTAGSGGGASPTDGRPDPMTAMRKERGRSLRKLLGDDTRLLKALARAHYVRDYLDRLDAWSLAVGVQSTPDMAIGPMPGANADGGFGAVRQLDPVTLQYQFLDQRFELPAIAAALILTHRAIAEWATDIARG